ncbi:hypothetical protein Ddc_01894 [Ditylenchus destructor]|nr:hypothetical protein Ddc_01894 [Ditylenchus destructor]
MVDYTLANKSLLQNANDHLRLMCKRKKVDGQQAMREELKSKIMNNRVCVPYSPPFPSPSPDISASNSHSKRTENSGKLSASETRSQPSQYTTQSEKSQTQMLSVSDAHSAKSRSYTHSPKITQSGPNGKQSPTLSISQSKSSQISYR